MPEADLNPLQHEVLETLALPPAWQPLSPGVVAAAGEALEGALGVYAGWFDTASPLVVSKHHLATVHGCEAHHMAERSAPFAWNVNTVRGTVVHKAIELLLNWPGDPVPAHVADRAMERIVADPRASASDFLASLTDSERSELRGSVVSAVTNFVECFPPLRPQWRPVVEHSVRYQVESAEIVLTARVDLAIGLPGRKVIIDVKTGRLTPTHREDLRFYALVESLRSRQSPRALASYSLESARLDAEEVSEATLQAAVRRTVAGIGAIAELVTEKRPPTKRPGVQCRWCPLLESCEEGTEHLERTDED